MQEKKPLWWLTSVPDKLLFYNKKLYNQPVNTATYHKKTKINLHKY